MTAPLVSAIIPTMGTRENRVQDAIRSVLRAAGPTEAIVVDGARDGDLRGWCSERENVRYIVQDGAGVGLPEHNGEEAQS